MDSFDNIWKRALTHHGDAKTIEAMLPKPKRAAALRKIPDDRWLSAITKQVFRAGFQWKVIDAKWDGFEAAFEGFDPRVLVMQPDEAIDRLASDTRIVRNPQKIRATVQNARFVCDIADEHGGFGAFVAGWPGENIVGLWEVFKKRGARLGGMTGPFTLRMMGKDTFIFGGDVAKGLIAAGVVDKATTSQKDIRAAQDAFNAWSAESGRPLCELSRILALSVG